MTCLIRHRSTAVVGEILRLENMTALELVFVDFLVSINILIWLVGVNREHEKIDFHR